MCISLTVRPAHWQVLFETHVLLTKFVVYRVKCLQQRYHAAVSIKLNKFDHFVGEIINSGLTHSSNSSDVTMPRLRAASFNVEPSLCAFFAVAAALS